jgi:hypothetical protein
VISLAAVMSGKSYASPGDDARPTPPAPSEPTPLARALADVDSPYYGIREAALASLDDLGASARPGIREAFRSGSERRRAALSRVLARGADLDDIRLLLDALTSAKDPATGSALRLALIEHAAETTAIVGQALAGVASPPPALVQLQDLLARARLEALFISRKSKSGGTGSYPGQYDVLRVDRKRALELCLAILANEDLHRPGVYPIGSFRFLRPPEIRISEEEVREMAANAIAELCEPGDTGVIERLKQIHDGFEAELPNVNSMRPQVAQIIALGLDDIVLPTLVSLGALETFWIDRRVTYHRRRGEYDDAAHLRMRMKEFREAVALFQAQTELTGRMVISYYNLACAYARWSAEKDLPEDRADRLRKLAVEALSESVDHGYPDWPWMEEDKDLEAIRDDPGYRRLVADLRRKYPPLVRNPASQLPPK